MVANLILLCSLKTYLSFKTWKYFCKRIGAILFISLFFSGGHMSTHSLPDAICRGVRSADYVVNILGDGIVKPADDALVLDLPLWITMLVGSGWGCDMGAEAEFAEEGIKEIAPLVVVGIGEFKNHRDMGFDVNRLQNGSWRSIGGGGGCGTVAVDGGSR